MKKLSIFENLNNSVFEAGIGIPNENDFVKAIKNRNYITFYYSRDDDGVLAGPRFVEPYCYGYRKLKNGQTRYYLRAWMIRNTALDYNFKKKGISSKYRSVSKSAGSIRGGWSKASGWRLYRVDSITNLYISGRRFSYYRAGYNGSTDVAIPSIIAQCNKQDFYGQAPK